MGVMTKEQQEDLFSQIADVIEQSQSIAICAHTAPDGDAIGSALALQQLIGVRWPRKQVTALLADEDEVPRIYRFLPGADRMVHARELEDAADLFICVDISGGARLNQAQEVWLAARRRVVIDHHPFDEIHADLWLVRPSAAATGVIVCEFAQYLGVGLTPDMARCLYCAIATDTGRFQYQNADGEAFNIAALLVEAGASPSELALNVYQNYSLSYLHLEAAVMGRIATFEGGRIAYSYATTADLERTGASLDECDGLVDVVRSVAGSELILFLKEIPGGCIRGNLRSKADHDVCAVARELGGGGHKAAAGFTVKGDLDEVLSLALPKLRLLLRAAVPEGKALR